MIDYALSERLLIQVKHVLDIRALSVMLKVKEHFFEVFSRRNHLYLRLLRLAEGQNRFLFLLLLLLLLLLVHFMQARLALLLISMHETKD